MLLPFTPTARVENTALVGGQQVLPVHTAQGNAWQNELSEDDTHRAVNYKTLCKDAGHQDYSGLFLAPAAES